MTATQSPTTDGLDSFSDISTFQQEVLLAIATLQGDHTASYGLAIKRQLEDVYTSEVNHGRLYPNLDELVSDGLVEKTALDKRTNEYTLTEHGEQFLCEQRDRLAAILDDYHAEST